MTGFLQERFGIPPAALAPWQVVAFSRQTFLVARQARGFSWESQWFVRTGLPFMRDAAGHLKPTTCFVQRFGHLATRNRIDLSLGALVRLCQEQEMAMDGDDGIAPKGAISPGYCFVFTETMPLGCCLVTEDGRLLNRLPKGLRQAFSRKDEIAP